MKVFVDVFTNDEVMSEIFPFTLEYEDSIMKVPSAYKKKDDAGNVDIGCGNAFGGDEEDGAGDSQPSEQVIDVVYNSNLVETQLSSDDLAVAMSAYLKKVVTYLVENKKDARIPDFKKGASAFYKFVKGKFDEFTFYTGSSESTDGTIIFSYWEKEDAAGPVFFFFKDGLREVKC
jgi:hypothetical protein